MQNMKTLTIYMRSGNVIKVRGLKDWTIEAQGNTVTKVSLKRSKLAGFLGIPILVLSAVDLSQIEAVVSS